VASVEELRAGVRKSLPDIEKIKDEGLRDKVVEAWAFALSQTEFTSIDQIPSSGNPDTPPMVRGTQSDHLIGVARMAESMAAAIESVMGPLFDHDVLIAGALCHDLGKPFEFSPRNQERWKSNPAETGWPSIRHPAYGVYVALTVGLPEKVAHACGAHSGEGELLERSLENTVLRHADHAWWRILDKGGLLNKPKQ
jgi:putative nucleotidyltransferase with HDIG domain